MNFKEHLLSFLPEKEVIELLGSLSLQDKHAVLLNPKKMSDEEFLLEFPHVQTHPYVQHAFIYDKNEYQLGKTLYHELGCFYLQEPSAMLVSSLIDFKEDDFVLDMCAAPGGKSIQASFKLQESGLIISNDVSRNRCFAIINNLERLGIGNIVVTNNDFSKIHQDYQEKFDVIILDAPCSGSGMFRKDDKMIADWSINKVYKNAEIQKNLISIAYQMLKPGGILSYSTCSYSIQENEDVVEYLLNNTDAIHEPIIDIKEAYFLENKPLGIRLMPSRFNGEGQYVCHIRKPGTKAKTVYNVDAMHQNKLPIQLGDLNILKFGETYFAIKNNTNLKGLNILRYGFKVGEMEKGIFYYDLHLARFLSAQYQPHIELNEEQCKAYIEGNVIRLNGEHKGFLLLTYKNKTIDFAKTDGQVIKNYYPKGLRKKTL